MTAFPHPAPRPPAPASAVARLRGPGEVAAALPGLLGFVPTASVVAVSLRGPRSRVGLVARVDLPAEAALRVGGHGAEARAESDVELVARTLAQALERDGAERVVVQVWSDSADREDGSLPHRGLVVALERALVRAGTPVDEAVLVRAGRWWSYTCSDPRCCPADGTPLPGSSPALRTLAAATTLSGRAVLPDRAALAASIAPPVGAAAVEARAAVSAARGAARREAARSGRARGTARALSAVLGALADLEQDPGRELPSEAVAAVVVGLQSVPVRDEVMRLLGTRQEALLGLLLHVARRTPPPEDAAVCAVLGAAAHVGGDGALARIALDRALDSDPEHGLALLLTVALDAGLRPEDVQQALTGPPRWRRRRGR